MHLKAKIYHGDNLDLSGNKIERKAVRGIIRKDNEFLMIYSPVNGDYKFPGGGVEKRESHKDALTREIEEECGLRKSFVGNEWGKIIEYSIAKEDGFDLFEMTSYYYECFVSDVYYSQNLDEYEKKLQFTPRWVNLDKAIEVNKRILEKGNPPRWTERDTKTLIILKEELNNAVISKR